MYELCRECDDKFTVLPFFCVNGQVAAMCFDDDIIAHGQAQAGTFACGLGCKEWLHDLFLYIFRYTGPVVLNADPVTAGPGDKCTECDGWFVVRACCFLFLPDRIKGIGQEI